MCGFKHPLMRHLTSASALRQGRSCDMSIAPNKQVAYEMDCGRGDEPVRNLNSIQVEKDDDGLRIFEDENRGLLNGDINDVESAGDTTTQKVPLHYRKRWLKAAIISWMVVFLVVLTVGVFVRLSHQRSLKSYPLILVSLDGFRYDYLDRNLSPTLQSFETSGVRADYMISQFPTKTFPNHYTLVTGLYPESHGIVDNVFYDPVWNETFSYKDTKSDTDGKWWGGEPIWVTAEKQGVTSATMFWPGSEAEINGGRPTYFMPYSEAAKMNTSARVDQLLSWIDLDAAYRPQLLTMYLSEVDSAGHQFSADSSAVDNAIVDVDAGMKRLLDGLSARNMADSVNIVVVSDHGMTDLSSQRVIFLDDFIDLSRVQILQWSAVATIYPQFNNTLAIYGALKNACVGQSWTVYLRENVPERYHYSNNLRISPILAVADLGWSFASRASTNASVFDGKGTHGFDNMAADMFALFIAKGPNFPAVSSPSKPHRMPAFQNFELYNVMCKLLNLKPSPNNGTQRILPTLLDYIQI